MQCMQYVFRELGIKAYVKVHLDLRFGSVHLFKMRNTKYIMRNATRNTMQNVERLALTVRRTPCNTLNGSSLVVDTPAQPKTNAFCWNVNTSVSMD